MRSIVRHVIWPMLAAVCLPCLRLSAQKAPACPPAIAQLLPANVVQAAGQYTDAGMMAMGSCSARIPHQQPCPCLRDDPNRARLSVELQHYTAEAVPMLKMQVDAVEQQTLTDAMSEFRRRQPAPSPAIALHGVRRETLAGGTVVLYDYLRACPGDCIPDGASPDGFRIPVIELIGVAHVEHSRVVVRIEGDLPPDLARLAAETVFRNLQQARFEKTTTGR